MDIVAWCLLAGTLGILLGLGGAYRSLGNSEKKRRREQKRAQRRACPRPEMKI